jgi:hypothetical protein
MGGGILLVAAWGALFVLLIAAISSQAPDPFIVDGDPCCGHPDTWGEVAGGVAWALGLVLLDALLVCLAVALLRFAATARWPRLKRVALLPGGAIVVAILAFAVAIVPQLDEAVTAPACNTFTFSGATFRSGEEHERKTVAHAIARCELLDGKTRSQVRRLLGAPTSRRRTVDRKQYWDYGRLIVYFARDRVARTTVG